MFWLSFSLLFILISLLWAYRRFTKHSDSLIQDLDSKYVLITGCGAGFGLLTAERLDKLGFRVFATCRTEAGEDNVRQRCSNRVKTFKMDVTSDEDLERTFNEVKKELSPYKGN